MGIPHFWTCAREGYLTEPNLGLQTSGRKRPGRRWQKKQKTGERCNPLRVILWMEEILYQLIDGLSHYDPIIYFFNSCQ